MMYKELYQVSKCCLIVKLLTIFLKTFLDGSLVIRLRREPFAGTIPA